MKTLLKLSLILVLIPIYFSRSETKSIGPRSQDLVGSWVGCGWGCTWFYRLTLDPGGTGTLVALPPNAISEIYLLEKWTLGGNQLTTSTRPLLKQLEPITLKVSHVDLRYLELEIAGVDRDWKRNITLTNEKDMEDRIRRTRAAIAKVSRSKDN